MSFKFEKATRKKVKLKVLIEGPSGSGKTFGGLNLAKEIAKNGRVAVIDAEKDRSEYYADHYDFDKVSLDDRRPVCYQEAITAAIQAGYDIIFIDGITQGWQNVLDRKDAFDKANPRSNSYTNWKTFSEEWDRFIRFILDAPVHIICTARAKQAHEQTTDQDGKKRVVKLGLAPQLRDGAEYEFAVVFSINESHSGEATKDNTHLFGDKTQPINLCDNSVGRKLNEWLSTAKEAPKPVPQIAPPVQTNVVATVDTKKATQPTATATATNNNKTAKNGKPNPAAAPATQPITLATIVKMFDDAKLDTGEQVGEWVDRIVKRLPEVAEIKPEQIDIVQYVRQEAKVHDLATSGDFWKHWTKDQVASGKLAVKEFLGQVKAKAA